MRNAVGKDRAVVLHRHLGIRDALDRLPGNTRRRNLRRRKNGTERVGRIRESGNIFSIMGDASTLLKKNKQTAEAKEMCKRVLESGDYYKALLIISEYVETELSLPPKENKRTKKKHQPER